MRRIGHGDDMGGGYELVRLPGRARVASASEQGDDDEKTERKTRDDKCDEDVGELFWRHEILPVHGRRIRHAPGGRAARWAASPTLHAVRPQMGRSSALCDDLVVRPVTERGVRWGLVQATTARGPPFADSPAANPVRVRFGRRATEDPAR